MKILAHYSDWNYTPERRKANAYGAVGYYRIAKPTSYITDHEVKLVGQELKEFGPMIDIQWQNIFTEFDVFWTGYFSDDRIAAAMYFFRDRLKKKVIIDIDDNYLDIPESNNLYNQFKRTKRDRAMLSTILSFADALTVSTYPLKERLHQHIKAIQGIDKPIYVIPNMNDYTEWEYPRAKLNPKKIVLGYWASNSHYDDLMMIMPAIKKMMQKHKNLYFQSIGTIERTKIPQYFKGFTDEMLSRIEVGAAESIFKFVPKRLSEVAWDIGIAPLVDTPFTRSKSHIKWMEYSMFKIPTIASRVYPYFVPIKNRKVIEDGVTGLLCRPQEWEEKLDRLITDANLRKKLGANAFEFVKKEWQYSNGGINEIANEMLSKI